MPIYPRSSISADVVKTLHQGDRVIVEYEVTSFYSFCKIHDTSEEEVSGFALCADLERPAASKSNWRMAPKNSPATAPQKRKK
jgi:hypothetical protein